MNENKPRNTLELNMEMIEDAFLDEEVKIDCCYGSKSSRLISFRFYNEAEKLQPQYVYLSNAEDFPKEIPGQIPLAFIALGKLPDNYRNGYCTFIEILDNMDLKHVFNIVSQVFEKYLQWDSQLQNALNNDEGILELCNISINFFKNPIFIHDPQFYITACPITVKGMTVWEKDERTGREMVPLSVINDFKIDEEYQYTLKKTGADIFSENLRGYRILYMNLWNSGRYEGRICVNELLSPLKKGHFQALEHFAGIVQIAIRRRNMEPGSFSRAFENVLTDMLERTIVDPQLIAERIYRLGWHLEDKYVWIKMGIKERNVAPMAAVGTCNHIETLIDGSYAFIYDSNILIIVNLTVGKTSAAECTQKLAVVLREGLFKSGVSNTFMDFSKMADYYVQASIALDLGSRSGSMEWSYRFKDYALEYIIENACGGSSKELLCSEEIQKLRRYDKKNDTDLYATLRVYLKNGRNAVQTAKELYIHRSTLLYRLERIMEITRINLDDPRGRLYLNLSYEILSGMEQG